MGNPWEGVRVQKAELTAKKAEPEGSGDVPQAEVEVTPVADDPVPPMPEPKVMPKSQPKPEPPVAAKKPKRLNATERAALRRHGGR